MGNVPPTARIAHLQSLGFTIAQCRAALDAADDDMDKAEKLLMGTLSQAQAGAARVRAADAPAAASEARVDRKVSRVPLSELLDDLDDQRDQHVPYGWSELDEVTVSEAHYVADLSKLCSIMTALRNDVDLQREDELAIFSNIETVRGVNGQLSAELHRKASVEDREPLATLAAAFEASAPYMRAYGAFCANAVSAPEALARARAAGGAPFEASLAGAEAELGETLLSLLKKPAERLGQYPQLLRALIEAVPSSHRAAPALRRAAVAVEAVAAEVNDKVRAAEERGRAASVVVGGSRAQF